MATVSSLPDTPREGAGLPPQAAGACQPPHKPRCGNCGLKHKPGKGSCPAEMPACHNCGRTGHMRKMCRSKGKQAAATEEMEASGIVIAATGNVESQSYIWVTISDENNKKSARIQVVPDTGAQVCVAGPGLLAALGITRASLMKRGKLRDVANISLKPMGSFTCCMQYGSRTTTQEFFII